MAIDPHNSPSSPIGPGYETSDANPVSIVKFGAALALALIIVAFGMRWVFGYFSDTQNLGPAASPFENVRALPPRPQLQVTPEADIHNYWETEQKILNGYGWVDKNNGVVRIPIDRAMHLTLERGLPARAAKPDSNSGPTGTETHAEASAKPAGSGAK